MLNYNTDHDHLIPNPVHNRGGLLEWHPFGWQAYTETLVIPGLVLYRVGQ